MSAAEQDVQVGARLELVGGTIDEDGRGVAEVQARQVHVPDLWPGERAKVRIDNLARFSSAGYGHLLELLERHTERRRPPCARHRDPLDIAGSGSCGGCPMMSLSITAQREAKRERVRGLGLVVDEIVGGDEWGYRWSSKRVVGGRVGALVLGSRRADPLAKPGQLADMAGCLVDHPAIEHAYAGVRAIADEVGIASWRPGKGQEPASGDLRYVWAKTDGERVLLTLITSPNAEDPSGKASKAARELPKLLMRRIPALAGVAWSVQPARESNAIRGEAPELLAGNGTLSLELAGLNVEIGPLGFLQPNPLIAARAYAELVHDYDGSQSADVTSIFDLYAGAGVTTGLLRRTHPDARVIPCESYPESARALGVEPQSVEAFLATQLAEQRPVPELVVANPPRGGLGEQVCSHLVTLAPARLHVMSCNPDTLAADLDRLRPRYQLVGLRGYDTLPQTAHLELVAWLRRSD